MQDHSDGAIRDERRSPFCYQTHDVLGVLRETFQGNRRATALAIYLCLTEAANRAGGAVARDGFSATRKEVAEAAGVSDDTLDRYVREMEDAGILRRERRRVEGVNLPNIWVLIEPPRTGSGAPSGRTDAGRGGRTDAAQGLEETHTKEGETSSPSGPPRLVKVDGRNLAMDALAEEAGIVDGDPRYKEVVAALNTRGREPGIRHLFWNECLRYVEQHPEYADRLHEIGDYPERFEEALARAIHSKAILYRERMGDAFLTPGALRKWWVSVDSMRPDRGGLTPEEIERVGATL